MQDGFQDPFWVSPGSILDSIWGSFWRPRGPLCSFWGAFLASIFGAFGASARPAELPNLGPEGPEEGGGGILLGGGSYSKKNFNG